MGRIPNITSKPKPARTGHQCRFCKYASCPKPTIQGFEALFGNCRKGNNSPVLLDRRSCVMFVPKA